MYSSTLPVKKRRFYRFRALGCAAADSPPQRHAEHGTEKKRRPRQRYDENDSFGLVEASVRVHRSRVTITR